MTKDFTIYNTDLAKVNSYPLTLVANNIGYTNTEKLNFQVDLIDPCPTATLVIDITILSSLAIEYAIGAGAHIETLDKKLVTISPTGFVCPSLFSIEYQSGGTIDADVFNYDAATEEFTT